MTATNTEKASYATGSCNAHVLQGVGSDPSDAAVYLSVNLTDAKGTLIGSNINSRNWNQTLVTDSKLPYTFLINAQAGTAEPADCQGFVCEKGVVDFAYGSQAWDTKSSQCSVGGWDNMNAAKAWNKVMHGKDWISNRQMDCKFDCPGS